MNDGNTYRRWPKIFRAHLIDLLSKIEGIEIAGQAEDSPSAVEAIERLKSDVAILDIRMLKGEGYYEPYYRY